MHWNGLILFIYKAPLTLHRSNSLLQTETRKQDSQRLNSEMVHLNNPYAPHKKPRSAFQLRVLCTYKPTEKYQQPTEITLGCILCNCWNKVIQGAYSIHRDFSSPWSSWCI